MKRAEERGEMWASRFKPIALLGAVSICCLSLGAPARDALVDQIPRADLVTFVDVASLGELDRPSVQFPHDLHTEVMADLDEDCTLCHPADEDGRLSLRFERLEGTSEPDLMDLYHESCIGCHRERAAADEGAGPVACGNCHRREPAYISSRQPFGMDKSLHYRHIEANDEKCESCHHLYDEEKEELVYQEGTEASCRDCHHEEAEENRLAFKDAAHRDCIGCHREPPPEVRTDSSGPQSCEGCHDERKQLAIEKVERPPRLQRKQPDFILLSASEADLESSKVRTVPFSHVDHEEVATSCRSCHHETLEACTECHTLKGSEEADGVTLYQAMHGFMAEPSCVACHETEKAAAECAGCHAAMAQRRLSEEGCDVCHAGPLPENLESERSRYTSMDGFRPAAAEVRLSFATDDVPETVTIGILSDQYEKAEMPHRKIVEKLSHLIGESSAATYFHGHEDVVCQGCHHQSPVGEKPPLCESCHGAESASAEPLKPGLLGAYHRQCLGCHQSMEIEKPSDCFGCHPAKEEGAEIATSSVDWRRDN